MPQRGAQHAGKVQLNLVVDLHLGNAGQAVFHRVFDRDDFQFGGVDFGQRGIQGGGFAGAGGPGDQHQTGAAAQYFAKAFEHRLRHANTVQAAHARALDQQPHDHGLAVAGGQGGQAHVNGLLFQADAEAAILRQTLFRNIKPRHQLEALGQGAGNAFVGQRLGLQDTIDPHPDLQTRFLRLNVHVGGADLNGVFKQRLQQAHHRRALDAGRCRELAKVNGVTQILFQRAGQAADLFGAAIEPVKRQRQLGLGHRRNGDVALEQARQLIKGKQVQRVAQGQQQGVAFVFEHQGPKTPRR